MSETLKEAVRSHWEADPCGAKLATAPPGTPEFYAEVERTRYALEPFIHEFAEFGAWAERDVLEIGIGLGTDFVQFVRGGANAQGVDLTAAAVDLVRRRLGQEGLDAEVSTADAESLPFADASFDLVYSWGVLHHTPDTERALSEVRRVLRGGGEARIMLYARRSWVALGAWAKYGLARGKPWLSVTDVLAEHMESPGTKAYADAELRKLFGSFSDVSIQRFVTPYDARVGGPLTRLSSSRGGWFAGIRARR